MDKSKNEGFNEALKEKGIIYFPSRSKYCKLQDNNKKDSNLNEAELTAYMTNYLLEKKLGVYIEKDNNTYDIWVRELGKIIVNEEAPTLYEALVMSVEAVA